MINNKIRNKKYRTLLFKSEYFRKEPIAISEYNKRDFTNNRKICHVKKQNITTLKLDQKLSKILRI